MSVTFGVYANGTWVAPDGWIPEYENDPDYGQYQKNQNPLEMNVANGNFCRIMELVGLDDSDYCGSWGDGSLQHVKERLQIALEGLKGIEGLDGGIPDEEIKEEGKGTMVMCGVREGYFTERITTLLTIVNKAIEVGGMVTYG